MTRVVVVGAGVVGLAVAASLVLRRVDVTVVDRDPAGDKASFGNAGGVAVSEIVPASVPGVAWKAPGWLFDPLGPLAIRPGHAPRLVPWLWRFVRSAGRAEAVAGALAALNGRSLEDWGGLLGATGLAGELRRIGALTVYERAGEMAADAGWRAVQRRHGIEIEELDQAGVRAMEPALGERAVCGFVTPGWAQVTDPKRIVDGLRAWVMGQGGQVVQSEVAALLPEGPAGVRLADGRQLVGDAVVLAAGAWSGRLARGVGEAVLLESERGYNTTLPAPGVTLRRQVTFASRHFVAAPLACGLRIGGAAEFGGLEAAADHRRSAALLRLAALYLPGLKTEGGVAWAGHRPSTPDSLPVIGPSRRGGVYHAFGHGHLGLTQAATTGRLVADLVMGVAPPIDLGPYAIGRFA